MRISFLAKDRASTLLSSKIIGQSDTPFLILLSVHFPHSYVVFASNSMTKPSLDSSLIPNVYEPLNPFKRCIRFFSSYIILTYLVCKKTIVESSSHLCVTFYDYLAAFLY